MSNRFTDTVSIVTGGASGIGEATVRRLIAEGGKVVAVDRDQASLDGLRQRLDSDSLLTDLCDVTSRADTETVVRNTVERLGRLDVLVNSAGISRRNVREDADFEEAWDAVINVNLKGSMLMCHAAVEAMRANSPSGGSIVNLGSIMSFIGYHPSMGLSDGFNAYPHSKGGVIQLTRDLGCQMAREGIRVNAVCPGFVTTPLTSTLQDDDKRHELIATRHPLGRFGTPEEIANVIVFLASSEASFVTGAAWRVDGGYVAA